MDKRHKIRPVKKQRRLLSEIDVEFGNINTMERAKSVHIKISESEDNHDSGRKGKTGSVAPKN